MSISNIEAFEEMAGKILRYLETVFPHPANVTADSIGIDVPEKGYQERGHWIQTATPTDEEKLFEASLRWLYLSGYIFATEDASDLRNVILTERGLSVLKRNLSFAPLTKR